MWLIVMFDLPVDDAASKAAYRLFRGLLLDQGFLMLQWSVYGRHCATRELTDTQVRSVVRNLPPKGQVRVLRVTEAQFARMEIHQKGTHRPPEEPPPQLELW